MSQGHQPIAVDESYKVRDNQFWYNNCSFRHLIENKQSIVLNIEGLGIRTLIHSEQGKDGRTTYSYKIKSDTYADGIWWEKQRGKYVRVELLSINEDLEKPSSKLTETSVEVEILRGYEVLPDNSVRFGVRVVNNNSTVITDAEVILDYPESLFKLQDSRIQKLGNIAPTIARTAKFILKPLGCVHKEFVEATIKYRDHTNEKHVVTMKQKEIHCVCPFLRAKPLTKGDFLELSSKGHSVETGVNFQGISTGQLKSFLMQTCANRLHKVDEYSIDGGNILYFSSESVGEKAYYLLTVLIKEQEDLTQVMLRAVSDKTHGIHGFLNEIISELKHMVHTVSSAKEIGIIKHEHVINIIDSVVQRTSFSLDGKTSVNVEDSVVQRNEVKAEGKASVNVKDSIVQSSNIGVNNSQNIEDSVVQQIKVKVEDSTSENVNDSVVRKTDFRAANRETTPPHLQSNTFKSSNKKANKVVEKRSDSKIRLVVLLILLLIVVSPLLSGILDSPDETVAYEIKQPSTSSEKDMQIHRQAPQASLRASSDALSGINNVIKLEHQGGDEVFLDSSYTKVIVNGNTVNVAFRDSTEVSFKTGDTIYIFKNNEKYYLGTYNDINTNQDIATIGQTANVKLIDIGSQQMIADMGINF